MTKELHLAATHGLSKAAQQVFTQILEAMQGGEEIGGTEDDDGNADYIRLMELVAKEALERVETAKANANPSPR